MLFSLRIQNFALIDELELEFGAGLNVLTGETGAGKSIILDAIDLVLGGKASVRMIRTGTDKAVIEGTFQTTDRVRAWLLDREFDLVHTSAAMHEMTRSQLVEIFTQVYRVLKPGGTFTTVDFHQPTNPLFKPGLAAFFWLFETQTAWALIELDLVAMLRDVGFTIDSTPILYAGGSLQVIQAHKQLTVVNPS